MADGAIGGDTRYKGRQGGLTPETGQRPPQRQSDVLDQLFGELAVRLMAGGDAPDHGPEVALDLLKAWRHGRKLPRTSSQDSRLAGEILSLEMRTAKKTGSAQGERSRPVFCG